MQKLPQINREKDKYIYKSKILQSNIYNLTNHFPFVVEENSGRKVIIQISLFSKSSVFKVLSSTRQRKAGAFSNSSV